MIHAKWTRIAGLCALLALTLHGAGVLAQAQGPDAGAQSGVEHLLHVLLLQPYLLAELPLPGAAGLLAEPPAPPVADALAPVHPSRGPPAA